MKEENRQERRIKVTIVTEENPTEFIKVKVNGTLNVYPSTNYMVN